MTKWDQSLVCVTGIWQEKDENHLKMKTLQAASLTSRVQSWTHWRSSQSLRITAHVDLVHKKRIRLKQIFVVSLSCRFLSGNWAARTSGTADGASQPLCPRSPLGPCHTATQGNVRQNSLAGLGWQEGAGLFTGQSNAEHFRSPLLSQKLSSAAQMVGCWGENPHPWTVTKADNKQATGLRNEGPPAKTALCEHSLSPEQICRVETVLRFPTSRSVAVSGICRDKRIEATCSQENNFAAANLLVGHIEAFFSIHITWQARCLISDLCSSLGTSLLPSSSKSCYHIVYFTWEIYTGCPL